MKYIRHSVKIDLDSHVNKDGYHPIRIRVCCGGSRIDVYSGISVKPNQWNKSQHKVRQGHVIGNVPYNLINTALDEHVGFVEEYFINCAMRNVLPNLQELKEKYNYNYRPKPYQRANEFYYLFDKFIDETYQTRLWTTATYNFYIRLRNRLNNYAPDITFSGLSNNFMNKFVEELATTMYNDAISKLLDGLRAFIRWAEGKNYVINNEYKAYNIKLRPARKAIRYLTIEELKKMRDMEITEGSALDCTRDFFLFQCCTALRYSDIKRLKHQHISQDTNGDYYIDIMTQKDKDRINFRLSHLAVDIYKKYKDNEYENGIVFPIISNEKYNEHLKKLGKELNLQGEWIDYEYKLDEEIEIHTPRTHLSTHTARRTFVCTVLNEGASTATVRGITSHSSDEAMLPYIQITSRGTDKVIDAFDQALE